MPRENTDADDGTAEGADLSRRGFLKGGAAAAAGLVALGATPSLAQARHTMRITPSPTGFFVPRNLTRGDRDFHGHGPDVTVRAQIGVYNTNELWAKVTMAATETVSDWTSVSGSGWYKIWDGARYGVERIHRIYSDTYSSARYRDTDHGYDTLYEPRTELVDRFVVRGDTKGDEAGTRTGVKVYFHPIQMSVSRKDVGTTTVTPDATGFFVPRNLTRGDRDFHDHGPDVTVRTRLGAYNTNELWAKVTMAASETTSDWTTVSGSGWYKVWDGDTDGVSEIVEIESDTYSSARYRDTDHGYDTLYEPRTELVDRFVVRGDTKGDEAGTRTGVKVYFHPVRMKVRW